MELRVWVFLLVCHCVCAFISVYMSVCVTFSPALQDTPTTVRVHHFHTWLAVFLLEARLHRHLGDLQHYNMKYLQTKVPSGRNCTECKAFIGLLQVRQLGVKKVLSQHMVCHVCSLCSITEPIPSVQMLNVYWTQCRKVHLLGEGIATHQTSACWIIEQWCNDYLFIHSWQLFMSTTECSTLNIYGRLYQSVCYLYSIREAKTCVTHTFIPFCTIFNL